MGLLEALKDIRQHQDLLKDGTSQNIPLTGMDGNAIETAYTNLLDIKNIRQTSHITAKDSVLLALMESYSMTDKPNDLKGFVDNFKYSFLELQASVEGWRADSLRDLTSGVRYQEQLERLARIRSGDGENRDLDGV